MNSIDISEQGTSYWVAVVVIGVLAIFSVFFVVKSAVTNSKDESLLSMVIGAAFLSICVLIYTIFIK